MIALLLAATLAASPTYDTVTTADGTRLVGIVVEESPTKGVTIQLADGTTRRLERSEVRKIEFADGSTTVWEVPAQPAAPVMAPPPVQAAPTQPAPQQLDTVYFAGGGRVRGRVLEEHPKDGVTVQLADGTVRHYAPEEVVRIQYADGYTSRRRTTPYDERPAPPRPVPQPMPQPVYVPPPAEIPKPVGVPQLVPLYGTIGLGGTWFGGDAEKDVRMNDVFLGQLHLSVEGGIRLNPHIAIAIYAEGGGGDVAKPVRDAVCNGNGQDCFGASGRIGFMLKHTWNPTSPTATWLGVGTGWEAGNVSYTTHDMSGNSNGDEVFTYRGREMFRLAGGVDFRSNSVIGVGLYGSVSWGTYDMIHAPGTGDVSLDSRVHETYQLGVRLILFP